MTAAADRALLADYKAGKFRTREEHLMGHITTIDTPAEPAAFKAALHANGRMTPDINTACVRREKEIGEKA